MINTITLMAATNAMLASDAHTALYSPFANPTPPNCRQPNGPSDRKARKERARELTRLREEAIHSGAAVRKTRRSKRRRK